MMVVSKWRWLLTVLALTLFMPSLATAQSAIGGIARDSSGGVLPGVNVEAASPALIEKVRSAVTDANGVYRIENLFPGVYTVTFSLSGFNTIKREALELPSNFTATVNADMTVGALEETVVVTGASPVVDTTSTARAQVINRELLDVLPTGKTAQLAAALVPGVFMANPDVAGAQAVNQNNTTAHGYVGSQTTVLLDGIQLQGMCGDGSTQSYSNVQNYEEITVQTSGAGADVAAGGVRQQLISRRGGNVFSGSGNLVYADGGWQPSALTPELTARGLRQGNKIENLSTYETGLGGKIIKDRLWWFGAARNQTFNSLVADTFYPDGRQGYTNEYTRNVSLRLTSQITPKSQITAFYDRVIKYLSHDGLQAGRDPVRAVHVSIPSPNYAQWQIKWTTTVSSKLLVDIGFNHYQAHRVRRYQPGVKQVYGSPEWFASASRQDTSLGTLTMAPADGETLQAPTRRFLVGAVSYVTGSHNTKFGVQFSEGLRKLATEPLNAGLVQVYQNGVPVSATLSNTPVRYSNSVNADLGFYGQDTWAYKRLSLSYGLRWEYFNAQIDEESSTPGRWIGARSYPGEVLPTWGGAGGFTPRLGVVYNLFGNGKTALKFGINKYNRQLVDDLTNRYNPIRPQTASVTWRDLDGDDIADGFLGCTYLTPGCELNLAQLPASFGQVTPGCSVIATTGSIPCGTGQVDPDIQRGYSIQYNIGVQHELVPRVSVNAYWFYSRFYDLARTDNILQSFNDYTPIDIASPLDGSVVRMYNVSAAARTRLLNLEHTATNDTRSNKAFETGFSARLGRGVTLFGGMATEHTLQRTCDAADDPNRLLYCDDYADAGSVPWLTQFKLSGAISLPFKIQTGIGFQTYKRFLSTATPPIGTQWSITPTTRYAADCKGPCTPGALVNPGMTTSTMNVPLVKPGTELSDRINMLDLNIGRWMQIGKVRIQPELAIFNALNNLAVFGVRSQNYLTSSYMQPSTLLQPRITRIGVQVKW
ncbi:MAG TPA: carboxypeptidase regulatory-like domain-containing protein [Vicinamibacterales bacterium]|nr:carboxypeptidase regulatory-like domain-containing protein [Vicinamibacterales bacterium]